MEIKVLQMITSLKTGGAEKLIIDSIPFYKEKGVESDVLCLLNEKTNFWEVLQENSKLQIFGLTKGSVYNPLLILKIIPYLSRYDLIHAHLFPVLYWVVLAKWFSFSKVRIVYTEHNTNNRRRNNSFFKILDRFIYRGVYKIVTISDEVDKNVKKHLGFGKAKFKMIKNGIDYNLYNTAKPYVKDNFFLHDSVILIQVSSFREQKDQMSLLRAMLLLPHPIKLLLVGDGPLREECESFVSDNDLLGRVLFLGNRTDVPRLLKTADIVVLSSNHEGLSLSSLEGMASGRPFVASAVPGLIEIVKDYGLVFPKGDSKELALLINKLITSKSFSKDISAKCINRAKMFDIRTMVSKYIELYSIIIQAK